MACTEVMSTYIKKLSHPLKEIRERSLQLLVAKLRLGWQLEDELAGTRELLEALLAWFHVQQPSLQKEALHLLLFTIKTKAGTYIAREFGIKKIIATLNKIQSKIEPNAMESYYDVLNTLRFLNSVESEDNVAVPPLTLNFLPGSESDDGSSCGSYNCGFNTQSSKESSLSNEAPPDKIEHVAPNSDGIRVLLFPWVDLSPSDSKTVLLVEDALKLLKSTRRCFRFICDVFLQDFPAEVFLNRPSIIKSLLSIADNRNKGRPGEALHVLYCITRELRLRLRQLSCLDLIHQPIKIQSNNQGSTDDIHQELESLAGGPVDTGADDALVALKQMPAPVYALDTANAVLAMMARSIALVEPVDKAEILDLNELNTCLNLVECLIQLLLDCVSDCFWRSEHNTKTLRDIAHKSCMVMRLLGDLLNKYRKSFYEDTGRSHHRIAWLRLCACAERMLHWARHSALPPATLATALQLALLDPALDQLYPQLSDRLRGALEHSRISIDQEYKSKYRELSKLCASMKDAAQFMMNKNTTKNSKQVLTSIKNSLPLLELHLSEAYLTEISEILLKKIKDFDLTDADWAYARSIALSLMAHNTEWVQGKFYRFLAEMVRSVLVGDEVDQTENEKCLTLLCDVGILTEVCCHGLSSKSKEVEACASDIMLYLLRGRLVLSEQCWWRLLASLLPVFPLLHVYAAHETQLGQAICKSLEPDIAECMGVSMSEVTMGWVRLLFALCPTVQMDAATALCRLLDDEKYLPPRETLRMDILVSAIRKLEPEDFNVDYSSSPSKSTSTTGLMQILDVLKQDIVLDDDAGLVSKAYSTPTLEPSLRRSMLQQLSVILRRQETHDAFLNCDGLKIIVATLRYVVMIKLAWWVIIMIKLAW
ncbi:rotatin, an armadillo repeat protein, centriole functioning domain-containing protein [Phthorimaea operculella]|nr:rotatin, an armadillo repeat protein, centriole functioning domain-containing protein [Phthorimaea operculella]